MKKLLFASLLVVFATIRIYGQENVSVPDNNSQQSNSNESKEERNKKTALASFSAYQTGDLEAMFKDYDLEVLTYSPGNAPVRRALDSLKMRTKSNHTYFTTAFPDLKNELLSAVAEGDYVMLYFESSGTWKGEAVPFKPTGKSFKARDVSVFKFNEAGKIIERHFVMPFSQITNQVSEGAEMDLNNSGYILLAQQKIPEAIEVFKLNVKLYPESSNTYDSLGEAYAAAGNKKLAIENYQKSIKLDPKNENAKKIVEKLKGQ
jgi:tetratricopeptide (TPR) repeat protein